MLYRRTITQSASEDRLQRLIEERLRDGADKAEIDRRIWDLFGERWCIMATDLSGFSRGVAEFGIIHFLQTIYESERLLVPIVERHDGILLKIDGDSFMVIFRNVQKAIWASLDMQNAVAAYNVDREPTEQVLLGVGLGFGTVLRIGDADVYGEEVNSAFILGEDTAKAHEILVTKAVWEAAQGMDDIRFEPIDKAPPGSDGAFKLIAMT